VTNQERGPRPRPRLDVGSVIDISVTQPLHGRATVVTALEWEYDSVRATARWLLGLAAAAVASLIVSVLKSDFHAPGWAQALYGVSSVLLALTGVAVLRHGRGLRDEFVIATRLVEAIQAEPLATQAG
jgi:hypothetical protein